MTWGCDSKPEMPPPTPYTPEWIRQRAADEHLRLTDRDAWLKKNNLRAWRTIHANDPEEIERRTKEATAEMLYMLGKPSPFR